MTDDPMLTLAEVAEHLKVSAHTARQLVDDPHGPPFVRVGRQLRIRCSSYTRWLETRDQRTAPTQALRLR